MIILPQFFIRNPVQSDLTANQCPELTRPVEITLQSKF